jgi:uncharacterized protein (TIGR03437 family)
VVGGPDLSYNGGTADAFVAKINAEGTALVYCGYIGGSGIDLGHGVAVDGAGNAYVTGETTSTQPSFPVTGGPDLTYNGGSNGDAGLDIAADGAGFRMNSGLSAVSVKMGGLDAQVLFAGAQGDFVGLDQANLRAPGGLIGRGNVEIAMMVDGKAANAAQVNIR